jgi:hypothetical protein
MRQSKRVGIVFRNLLKSPFVIWQFYNFYVFCDVLMRATASSAENGNLLGANLGEEERE